MFEITPSFISPCDMPPIYCYTQLGNSSLESPHDFYFTVIQSHHWNTKSCRFYSSISLQPPRVLAFVRSDNQSFRGTHTSCCSPFLQALNSMQRDSEKGIKVLHDYFAKSLQLLYLHLAWENRYLVSFFEWDRVEVYTAALLDTTSI